MILSTYLSNYMKTLRLQRNESITEFAEVLGLSRSETQRILNGTCNPRLDTIEHIAKNLDVDPRELLGVPCNDASPDFRLILEMLNTFCQNPMQTQEAYMKLIYKLLFTT